MPAISAFTSAIARLGSALPLRRRMLAVLAVASLLFITAEQVAHSATIDYGSFPGNTVTYVDVSETSITDTPPLFGAPNVSGDSIDFNPTGFAAFSSGGGADLTDGQLVFMVVAKPGYGIDNISFYEAGVTTVVGNGTDATYTSVSAVGTLNIQEVNGVGIGTISMPINLAFTHRPDGIWELVTDGVANSLPWQGSQFLNIKQELIDQGKYAGVGATKISIDLDNALIASSEDGSIAFLDKKDFGGVSITVNIPEPASLFLAGLALAGLLLSRRPLQ